MPAALGYLWAAFVRLRRRKGANGFAISPIEWADLDAFNRLSESQLSPWEISVIEELDDMFLKEQNKPRAN